MQKPGTNPTAQPEIQFAGSLDVPASQAPRDPAVAAAFMAFHRRTDGGDRAAAGKGPFSRGAVALASLAFLGFGGGLFLAFFSFNSPEGTSSRVAARPPEVIYTARMVAMRRRRICPPLWTSTPVNPPIRSRLRCSH
jgi:hypothetical protein